MAEPAEGPWRYGPQFHQTIDRDAHEIVAKGHAIGLAWTEENARHHGRIPSEMLAALECSRNFRWRMRYGPNDDVHCVYCSAWLPYEPHDSDCVTFVIAAAIAKARGETA